MWNVEEIMFNSATSRRVSFVSDEHVDMMNRASETDEGLKRSK